MNPKIKKALIFTGIGLDVVVTSFLFVVAIIMIATMPEDYELLLMPDTVIEKNGAFIGNLQLNSTLYFWTCVFPLILLLVGNIALLVLYIVKASKKKTLLSELSEDQKAALRAELMKDMNSSEEKKEE